ncbi:hypothetical protein DER46DRAFT_495085, partial [Fusarium sp. MPI-SDFR-AT-0072]
PKSPVCRFSRRIILILNYRGIVYDSFNVLTDEDVRQGLKKFADLLTFPQLWVDGELVGGLDVIRVSNYVKMCYLVSGPMCFLNRYSVKGNIAQEHFSPQSKIQILLLYQGSLVIYYITHFPSVR